MSPVERDPASDPGPAGRRVRPLVPVLLATAALVSGCAGSLARMIVEPSAADGLLGPGLTAASGQLAELRSATTEDLEADTLRVAGAAGAVIHLYVLEPGPYGLDWDSSWDGDGFRFSMSFESDSVDSGRRSEPRGTVLFLHGLYAESLQLLPHALHFAERGYRAVLVDLRAHGQSGGRYVTFGVRERHDVAAVVDALRERRRLDRPLVLYGTSLGGAVALQGAATGVPADRVVAVAPMAQPREVVTGSGPEMLPDYLGWLVSDDRVEAAVGRAARIAGFTWADASTLSMAPRVDVPVLLVHGREDDIVPFDHAARLHEGLPCSTLLPVDRHGHATLMMDPEPTAGSVLSWLSHDQTCWEEVDADGGRPERSTAEPRRSAPGHSSGVRPSQ